MAEEQPNITPVERPEPQKIDSEESQNQVMRRFRAFLVLVLVIIGAYTTFTNMDKFPHYQDAEGTNIANGQAMLEEQEFAPYTYAYEESPLLSIAFGAWGYVTDGFTTTDFPIYDGRLLMLLLRIVGVMLVYMITFKLTESDAAAVVATLLFIFSPLSISLQRRVLEDNIMLVLLLASFYLLLGRDQSLYRHMASSVFFGLAVLFKMSIFWLMPAYLITILLVTDRHNRRFAFNLWLAFSLLIVSLLPLYANMREELFPQPDPDDPGFDWFGLGGDFPHVSLIERITQVQGGGGQFQDFRNSFQQSFSEWTELRHLTADPVLIFGGVVAFLFVMLIARDNRTLRPLVIVTITFVLGLILRGRVVVTDILPLLPILAICVGSVIVLGTSVVSSIMGKGAVKNIVQLVLVIVLTYPFWTFYLTRVDVYITDQTTDQVAAVNWISANLPDDSLIVTDAYAFTALRTTMDTADEDEDARVHHYWKVDTDPDIKFSLLEDTHCNIDYVVTTPQVYDDIEIYSLELMRRALENGNIIREYANNGWPIEIWQVDHSQCALDS